MLPSKDDPDLGTFSIYFGVYKPIGASRHLLRLCWLSSLAIVDLAAILLFSLILYLKFAIKELKNFLSGIGCFYFTSLLHTIKHFQMLAVTRVVGAYLASM